MIGGPPGSESLRALRQGQSATWEVPYVLQRFAVKLPEGQTNPVMLTFEIPDQSLPIEVSCEVSNSSSDGRDGAWVRIERRNPARFLDKFVIENTERTQWIRFTLRPIEEADLTKTVNVTNIGLYDIDPHGRNDYWVVIGASIQWQSIRQDIFHQMVTERFPGYDPVIFNEAISGWRTSQLVNALPGFLEKHPHASYIPIHIGGNNVSAHRPYPGGAEELRTELETILTTIQEAGRTPILSRLSYRAYHERNGQGPVPPEENGSGPYVENIYDPLIRQYCPAFFDFTTGKGKVDAYGWFRDNPDELSSDGIHVNPAGARSWNRLWAEGAGNVVYRGR